MGFKEFIVNKTRVAITWFTVIVIGLVTFMAACSGQWEHAQAFATILASVTGAYQLSQSYTKGEFIKKVGKVDENKINKTIEP